MKFCNSDISGSRLVNHRLVAIPAGLWFCRMLVEKLQDAFPDLGPGLGMEESDRLFGDAISALANVVTFSFVSGIERFVGPGRAVVVKVFRILGFAQRDEAEFDEEIVQSGSGSPVAWFGQKRGSESSASFECRASRRHRLRQGSLR